MTNIIDNIVDEKISLCSSKGISPIVHHKYDSTYEEGEKEVSINVTNTEDEIVDENDVDVFDMSMKRLDFIENSFKTMYTEELPAIEDKSESKVDIVNLIRDIIKSDTDTSEKLSQIEKLVNPSAEEEKK